MHFKRPKLAYTTCNLNCKWLYIGQSWHLIFYTGKWFWFTTSRKFYIMYGISTNLTNGYTLVMMIRQFSGVDNFDLFLLPFRCFGVYTKYPTRCTSLWFRLNFNTNINVLKYYFWFCINRKYLLRHINF